MRLLLIEDEKKVANVIARGLRAESFSVDVAHDGDTGWELAAGIDYDVIVLDLMLPGISGTEVLRRLRRNKRNAAVLVLTARDATTDKVENFEAGADDYLTKPFAFAELLVRVKSLLRRPPVNPTHVLRIADLELDRLTQQVRRAGNRIELTSKEYALLEYMISHAGRVLTRTMIIEHVWDESFEGLTNIVDVYVRHLREKVDVGHERKLIRTVRYSGYCLTDAEGEPGMNTRSLRFRLVLWYALWLGLVFLTTGALLYLAVGHYLEGNLGQTQMSRAKRVATLVERLGEVSSNRYAVEITADFAPEASGRFIRLSRPNGLLLYESGRPQDQSFEPGQITPPSNSAGVRREKLAGGPEMMVATLMTTAGGNQFVLIETGQSLVPALKELHRLLVSLELGFVVVMVVALAGGHVLVNRALRSVAEITRSAEGITSRNLSERLPVPPTGDEFEHLSQALNRMIARLDEAFQHNRRFLADASHELRTPLTILHSELEAMEQRDGLDPKLQETIGNLLEEVHRLTRIVENLFALSRFEAGLAAVATSHFDLAKLAATTAEQMCLLAEDKGIKITCQTATPVFVDGDRGRFKQVIVNLLDNAVKYTPPGGAVTLTVKEDNGQAVCEVGDNGIGIPATALPQVFDRFFRVDQARSRELGGAGIGLSIVKAICLAHNGRVTVESTEGSGSCFRVYLPLPGKTNLNPIA